MKLVPKLLLSVVFAITSVASSATAYTNMVVFGDSLSDPGNALFLTGGNPATLAGIGYYVDAQGHFSNGPTTPELLTKLLGGSSATTALGWDPAHDANAFSVNYAVGGALSGAGHRTPALSFSGIASQVNNYSPGTGSNLSSTLFFIQGGGNDLLQGFENASVMAPSARGGYLMSVVDTATTNMAKNVFKLGMKGADNILLSNLPDLGLTPIASIFEQASPGFKAQASGLTDAFNQMLALKIGVVDAILDDYLQKNVNIMTFDTAAFTRAATIQPGTCLGAAALPSCTGFFFYDAVHPTTAIHQEIANQMFAAAVPEPETWAMLIVGLGLISLRARRKA